MQGHQKIFMNEAIFDENGLDREYDFQNIKIS